MARPRLPGAPRAGLVAPALLFLGMAGAVLLFARSYRDAPAGRSSTTRQGFAHSPTISPNDSAAAAAAHRAAGVPAGGDDAATVFHQRVRTLEKRLATEPGRRDLVVQLARLLRDGHRPAEAIPYFRKAIAMDTLDAQAYYDLASVYAGLSRWSDAADVLRHRLARNARDAVALYDLGAVRANQGRADEARTLFERARTTTRDPTLLSRVSRALARLRPS